MRIVLLYNEPLPSRYDAAGESAAVAGVMESVSAIETALVTCGHAVERLGLRPPIAQVLERLRHIDADVVFNLFEGFDGTPETEAEVADALEQSGLAFTGARADVLRLCLDKARTKAVLSSKGIATPEFDVFAPENPIETKLAYPLIVKPAADDASHGISAESVVFDPKALAAQVARVFERSHGSALVERFIDGREFNATVLGGPCPKVLPPSEIAYTASFPGPRILTFAAKWDETNPAYIESAPVCPAQVDEDYMRRIERLALDACAAVGGPDYARVDMRADRDGGLYVLEVNPNPDMGPSAGMAIQARAASMTYRQLVDAILSIRIGREVVHGESETVLCPAMNGDLETLVRLTDETGFFRAEEVETAREVLDEGLEDGATSGYFVQVAAVGGEPAGYVCVGPTPMTRGTWDVYWLAVSPAFQRRGLGRMLMEWAEEYIRECGGLRSVIETSSTDQYVPTRAFYQKAGYREICQIPDYYDIGDSKVILFKSLVGGTKSCNQNPGQQSQATFKAYPNPGA